MLRGTRNRFLVSHFTKYLRNKLSYQNIFDLKIREILLALIVKQNQILRTNRLRVTRE